jgi:hypothetical protein
VAGLARLAGSAPDGSSGRGLSLGEISLSASLGVSAYFLWQQVVPPLAFGAEAQSSVAPSALPLAMFGASVALVVLFALARVRKNVPAQATAAPE